MNKEELLTQQITEGLSRLEELINSEKDEDVRERYQVGLIECRDKFYELLAS